MRPMSVYNLTSIFNDSIQFNAIQICQILYCIIHWPYVLLIQLTRAGTKAFKFHLCYKPFEKCDTGLAARAILLQNDQYFNGFISNYEKSESTWSLTGPQLKCDSRLRHFICFDATHQITMARVMVL